MKDASFHYSTRAGSLAGGVGNVTTTFVPGQSTAIVGRAGSGKSTLLQLLLGQLRPQKGSVTIGEQEIASLSGADRAAMMALTPQAVVLFDGTIADNLYFGTDPPETLPEEDKELLEQLGILEMCKNRALDLDPGKNAVTDDVRKRVVEARACIARSLAAAGIELVPAHRETPAAYWMIEQALGGRADHSKVLAALSTRDATTALRALASSPAAAPLIEWGKLLVSSTKHSLMLPSYAVSAKLAPFPIDQEIWELRRACAARDEEKGAKLDADLLRVTLTSSFAELSSTCGLKAEDRARIDRKALLSLGDLVRDVVVSLEEGMVHPFLSWRDNLVFASMTLQNRRQGALVDRVVLEQSLAAGLGPVLERAGLAANVGRAGSRLSGGQRQLIAVARTLLRRTPIVILDEPTSALDPASRARVSKVLDAWKTRRIIIVVTHDPEVARACDDIRMIERGHLVASGSFEEVAPRSTLFTQQPPRPVMNPSGSG
jgi:ABC-type cobalamin/Fe3+-siderophores transport system ATPase subunit